MEFVGFMNSTFMYCSQKTGLPFEKKKKNALLTATVDRSFVNST